MIKQFLKNFGLKDKEIEIYLAGIKSGPVSAAILAKKTGISRQNTYDVLKKLQEKDLTSIIGNRYNSKFVMEDPVNIKGLLEKKKRELDKAEKKLDLILPELEKYSNTASYIPRIKFYEGKKNIEGLFLDIINSGVKEILAIVPTIDLLDIIGTDFAKEFVRKKAEKKITTKTIRIKSRESYADEYFFENEKQLRQVRYAPDNTDITSTLAIYADKVIFVSSEHESFVFVVESNEYSKIMRGMFHMFWKNSK